MANSSFLRAVPGNVASPADGLAGSYRQWLSKSQLVPTNVVQEKRAAYGTAANDASVFVPMGDQVVLDSGRAAALVKQGLRADTLDSLAPLFGLDRKDELLELVRVNASSLWRWEKDGKSLPEAQVEQILRAMSLSLLATTVFGGAAKAWEWLKKAHPLLDQESPIAYASNEFGAQKVRSMLVALRYGGAV